MELKSALQVFSESDVPVSPGVVQGLTIKKLAGDAGHPSERISVGLATFAPGTHEHLHNIVVESTPVKKISEGTPNIIDVIRSGDVHLVLNTLSPDRNPEREGARIRRASVEHAIPCLTSLDTARALLFALSSRQKGGDYTYLPIQEYVAISAKG